VLEAAPWLFQRTEPPPTAKAICLLRPPPNTSKQERYRFVGATVSLCRKHHLHKDCWVRISHESRTTIGRIHTVTKEECDDYSFWSCPEIVDITNSFLLSPDLMFSLHPERALPSLDVKVERLTNPNALHSEVIPLANLLTLRPISVNHTPELEEVLLRNFFTNVCDIVVEGEVIGIPIPKSRDLRAVPDPWKLLEERNLVSSHSCLQFGTGRTKYGATTPPFASSMIYYTVHACEPHFECFSKIDLKGHSTTLKIVEPKRGQRIPHLLELYTSPEWRPEISWTWEKVEGEVHSRLFALLSDLSFAPPVLLIGERMSGKRVLVSKLARQLQVQLIEVNTFDLLGSTCSETCDRLQNVFAEAASLVPCILHLRRVNALMNEMKYHDLQTATRAAACLHDAFQNIKNAKLQLGVIASCEKVYDMPSDVRTCFTNELTIEALESTERQEIVGSMLVPTNLENGDEVKTKIAEQTAGLQEGHIREIVSDAVFQALSIRLEERENLAEFYGAGGVEEEELLDKPMSVSEEEIAKSLGWSSERTFAKLAKIPSVYWEDIGGLEEAKQEIIDTVEMPIKYPDLFETQRTGVLLYGPPGTGKTLLAKAVATECGLNFISVKGPELLNMYVGESERNVRDVFERARNAKPCVLFFDEIDSIAPRRGNGSDGGGVIDRVVSQILTELDGMDDSKDVFLIAATNRPDLLDPALMRPGRIDKQIYLGIAEDVESKIKILEALTRKFRLSEDAELETLVQCLQNGFTGADYYALCSDALMRAYRKKIDEINARVEKLQRKQPGKHSIQTVLANMSQEELNVCVHLEDFFAASMDLTPSLTPAEIERYRDLKTKLSS